ncbi:MAG: Ribosomal RNA small subunit methyltransferase H [Chlamydiae bacterium]|nr:Ribosomal RNA small subunit methyltransferase H [Chlamydiota bacterium]
MTKIHHPVLLEEVLRFFGDLKLEVFVDGTIGAAGHSEALLQEHPEIGTFLGIDQDPLALDLARQQLEPWKEKVILKKGNFSDLEDHLEECGLSKIDGMLLDLGVSSMQLDRPEKGFSFNREGPLDMRMDPSNALTAADIVNTWSEKELGRIFRDYGEERRWRAAASAVVQARKKGEILTTTQLVDILFSVLRSRKKQNLHPLTLIFQALRICVNRELERIEQVIPQAIRRLKSGGRLAVISFHSLEDRIVKNAFRYAASDKENTSGIGGMFLSKKPEVRIITRKPVIPTLEEVKRNPRSRSSKLRVVEKLD